MDGPAGVSGPSMLRHGRHGECASVGTRLRRSALNCRPCGGCSCRRASAPTPCQDSVGAETPPTKSQRHNGNEVHDGSGDDEQTVDDGHPGPGGGAGLRRGADRDGAAGRLQQPRQLADRRLQPGHRFDPAGAGRQRRPRQGDLPGLRLQRRLRLCRDPPRDPDRVSGQLPVRVPAARRFAEQRPAVQAGRRQRRQRVVGQPAALRLSQAVEHGQLQEAADRQGLGPESGQGTQAQRAGRVHPLQPGRRQGHGVLRPAEPDPAAAAG